MAETLSRRLTTFFEVEMPLPSKFADLATLYELFRAAAETFMAVLNQPRGSDIDAIDELHDAIARQADRIADVLRGMSPTTKDELYYKAKVVTDDDFRSGQNIKVILAGLATLSAVEFAPEQAAKPDMGGANV